MGQLELGIGRYRAPDRNAARGGRSFYFFDFDDNVMRLGTSIYVFHRETGAEVPLSTRQFAEVHPQLGEPGPWESFEVRHDEHTGSFRRFRDLPAFQNRAGQQPFLEDLNLTLQQPQRAWQGPSWDLFDHAIFNQRPVAIITARGHDPDTMAAGIKVLYEAGHLTSLPNYLGIFPVSNRRVRQDLGDPFATLEIPVLKRLAIVRAVELATQRYGHNSHHRFGMSDDDPRNVEIIVEAMKDLKRNHPDNAFFVIDTSRDPVIKTEVLLDATESQAVSSAEQLDLFD